MSFSCLKDSGCCGSMMMRVRRALSSTPSSRSKSHDRFCCAIRRRCRRLASRATTERQVLQLLVEIFPQPRQFVGVAQLVGVDHLVELLRIGLVLRRPPLLRLGRRGPVLGRLLRVARLAFVLELGRGRLDRVHRALVGLVRRVVGGLALHRILRLALLALAFGLVRLLGRRVLLVVGLVLGVGVRVAREAERGQELLDESRVGALVEDRVAEPVEVGPGLLLDEPAPEFGQPLRPGRRLQPGQALARQHRHRLLERRLVAGTRLGEGALA